MTVKEQLQKYTGKENIYLVRRGNIAIREALRLFPDKTILLADQGGWLTYDIYAKNSQPIGTDSGIINPTDLEDYDKEYLLLVNSLAGYAFPQNMERLSQHEYLLINDATGSIGTQNAKYGDIILGSFGKDKPVNLGEGAFIASDKELNLQEDFNFEREGELLGLLEKLPERLKALTTISNKIKEDLKDYKIIHPEMKGINVIVAFDDEEEKQKIIQYCEKNNYPYTECPREIRVTRDAISIEVKRL